MIVQRRAMDALSYQGDQSMDLDYIPPPPMDGYHRRSASPDSNASSTYAVTAAQQESFFREVHGRKLNSMNPFYMLPADHDELKRLDYQHRLFKIVLADGDHNEKNYVGPVPDILAPQPPLQRRVLDCGTGGGLWAVEIADEFPHVAVTGVDLAPIQPREVPPNCSFELFDLDGQRLPYPDAWFDVVHARSVYTGIRNYPLFVREIARVLRRGGIAILAESESAPMTETNQIIPPGPQGGAAGWVAFWDYYRHALTNQGIDITIPSRLRPLLAETRVFSEVVGKEALIPVGNWDQGAREESMGNLAWMDSEFFLPATKPFLISSGLSESDAHKLIADGQRDLYSTDPDRIRLYSRMHWVYARKA